MKEVSGSTPTLLGPNRTQKQCVSQPSHDKDEVSKQRFLLALLGFDAAARGTSSHELPSIFHAAARGTSSHELPSILQINPDDLELS